MYWRNKRKKSSKEVYEATLIQLQSANTLEQVQINFRK